MQKLGKETIGQKRTNESEVNNDSTWNSNVGKCIR